MNEELRQMVIETLRRGEELPIEWAPLLFPPRKREYELTYVGKERAEEIIGGTLGVPLQAVRTFGQIAGDDAWRNMLVFGDNLQGMKTLLDMKQAGRLQNPDGTAGVKLVYIDPPFATEQDFKRGSNEKAYHDKIAGTQFVESLRKRLVIIRELLSPTGSLVLHVDYRKGHYLKVILDEVFGESNFRNEIMLPGRASKNLQQQFDQISRLNVRHDVLFWYSASTLTKFSPVWQEKHNRGNPNGHWHHFWSTADRPTMRYELFGITPETGQWTWSEEKAREAIANHERYLEECGDRTLAEYWRDTGGVLRFLRMNPDDGTPQYWRPPSDVRLADTVWAGIPIYSNRSRYPTEKNEALLNEVVELTTDESDIVLDAFAGSGTTCAVAEKLGRRWIAIDSGKLAIYTIQKRMLSLKEGIGQKGKALAPKPFTLYNAGLYDFSTLRQLPWQDWRFFALQLFGCRDEPHTIGGLKLDGKRQGASVLVFDHLSQPGRRIDEETIETIHAAVGDKVGSRFFIIAPRGVFDFQQDYIDLGDVRYFALRIPYSFINELHHREFTALKQPSDETDVNAIVDAVGFDFIRPPQVTWAAGLAEIAAKAGSAAPSRQAYVQVEAFESRAYIRGQDTHGGLETLSLVMVDLDYDGDIFVADQVHFAAELKANEWRIWLASDRSGAQAMVVFIDIFGNEAREIVRPEHFGLPTPTPATAAAAGA